MAVDSLQNQHLDDRHVVVPGTPPRKHSSALHKDASHGHHISNQSCTGCTPAKHPVPAPSPAQLLPFLRRPAPKADTRPRVGPYILGDKIGQGSCATVRRAYRDGRPYACKTIIRREVPSSVLCPDTEVATHRACSGHANIVTLESVATSGDQIYLFQHMANRGDMFDKLTSIPGNLTEGECARYLRHILGALSHVHAHGIAHRDIKVENLLLDRDPETGEDRVLLCDFGFATFATRSGAACGTLDYAAPEVLRAKEQPYLTQPVDVWSAGVVFYVLLTGCLPFESHGDKRRTRFKISTQEPVIPHHVSPEARSLVLRMLTKDPAKRATVSKCLKSEFLASGANPALATS